MAACITLTSTYNSSPVFWITTFCNIFGILLNSVFIYTIITINDKKKIVDKTILAVTVVKLLQTSVAVVKSSFKYSLNKEDFDMSTINAFETLEFLLQGLYTWSLLSLTIARILVLKNVNVVQNPKTRFQVSQICMTLSITINIIATVAYGIVLFIMSPVRTSQASIIKRILKFIIMDVSWMFVIIMNLVLVVYITVIFVRTNGCRIRNPRQYTFSKKNTHKNKTNVFRRRLPRLIRTKPQVVPQIIHRGHRSSSRKLLRQVLMSVLLLIIFNIAPSTYVSVSEMLVDYLKHNIKNQIIIYVVLSACSNILNPISFGLFSKERRTVIKKIVNPSMFSFSLSGKRRPTFSTEITT